MGQKQELEDALYTMLADGYRETSKYDYLVLFSGGKDSSYIAHKLKQAKGGRVCLFTVENGFENEDYTEKVKKTAALLNSDLYIYQPQLTHVITFYRFLISEPALREFDSNPLCFFCGRYFLSLGVEFAERNNIPFVFHGASPEQINKGQDPDSVRAIQLFNAVSKKHFRKIRQKIKELATYQQNPIIQSMFDNVFYTTDKVTSIFPFQYLEYHIDQIKTTLEEEYGWVNPVEGLPNEKYLSSGCRMTQLFGLLEKKAHFKAHELEQFTKDFQKGMLSQETYEYNKQTIEEVIHGNVTVEMKELKKMLGVEDIL